MPTSAAWLSSGDTLDIVIPKLEYNRVHLIRTGYIRDFWLQNQVAVICRRDEFGNINIDDSKSFVRSPLYKPFSSIQLTL